jgi:heme exporter protein CcmD
VSFLGLPHIGFVIAAYAAGLVVVALLIGLVVHDYSSLRRALAAHEAKGVSPSATEDALR